MSFRIRGLHLFFFNQLNSKDFSGGSSSRPKNSPNLKRKFMKAATQIEFQECVLSYLAAIEPSLPVARGLKEAGAKGEGYGL